MQRLAPGRQHPPTKQQVASLRSQARVSTDHGAGRIGIQARFRGIFTLPHPLSMQFDPRRTIPGGWRGACAKDDSLYAPLTSQPYIDAYIAARFARAPGHFSRQRTRQCTRECTVGESAGSGLHIFPRNVRSAPSWLPKVPFQYIARDIVPRPRQKVEQCTQRCARVKLGARQPASCTTAPTRRLLLQPRTQDESPQLLLTVRKIRWEPRGTQAHLHADLF